MLDSASFRRGLRDGFPVFLAVGVFGIAFGVLAVQTGLAPWLAVVSSVVVVSGAAQFALVGLLVAGPGPVLVATTGLALRHLPMSAKLADLIGERSLRTRVSLAWVLTDETFGLTLRASQTGVPDLVAYKAAADVMLYSAWVTGTAVGAFVGRAIDPAALGIDVLFALLFLGLAAPLIRTRRDWLVVGLAVASAMLGTLVLPEAWQITGAATAAALIGTAIRE
ncbi:MAG: AzlC family ABC transporter permease [Acidimicrobiia bacterium]|nr:AzlC family ABC transporter permease [Acidimicrobiia bacterium]MDH3398477.1 AzlC family ABC transporter permease [Acidimicrobiia bacterium]MDH5615206.1 AzlC family ABC transporter permease [Acidimicrobiia bacterium]